MANFKKVIDNEIASVFLNLSEFGELGEICGHYNIPLVIQNLEFDLPPSSGDERPGISYEALTVYAKAADVPEELFSQKKITFQGEEWFVLSASCECGLKKIDIYRERA